MQRTICTLAILTVISLPTVTFAQNDAAWARFGLGIADAAIRGATSGGNNGPSRPRYAPYSGGSPNSSGGGNLSSYDPGGAGFFNGGGGGGFNTPSYNRPSYNRPSYRPSYTPSLQYSQPSYSYNSYASSNYSTPSYHSTPRYKAPTYNEPPRAPKVYSQLPIIIRCPDWCEGHCRYELVTGAEQVYNYQIGGGQKQTLVENTDWSIRVYPGNGPTYKTYNLRGGQTYELHKEAGGWAFYIGSSQNSLAYLN